MSSKEQNKILALIEDHLLPGELYDEDPEQRQPRQPDPEIEEWFRKDKERWLS